MATVASPQPQIDSGRDRFATSRFDVVTSLFLALIGFIGIFVAMLVILWLTSRWTWGPPPLEMPIENPAGRGDNAEGFERDFEPPGEEEVEDLLEPTLADTVEAITEAVSTVAASLTTADTNQAATSQGAGGAGDSRPPGPEGEGDDIVPRFLRWELRFNAKGIDDYAQQLDHYKIELGALGGGSKVVDGVKNLSGGGTRREVAGEDKNRLYFMFNRPTPLSKYDAKLLSKAGVKTGGDRVTLKFIEKELEAQLATIELAYAKDRGHDTVKEIAKTIFESSAEDDGYEFIVISQRYRKPRW